MITGKSNIMQKQGDFIARKLMLMEARLLRCERLIEEYRCKCGDKEEEKNELSFADFVEQSGSTLTFKDFVDTIVQSGSTLTFKDFVVQSGSTLTFKDFVEQSGSTLTFKDFVDTIVQSGSGSTGEKPEPEWPDPEQPAPDTLTFADKASSKLTFSNLLTR